MTAFFCINCMAYSVPWRGYRFQTVSEDCERKVFRSRVSVPWRGYRFQTHLSILIRQVYSSKRFPSPDGDIGFKPCTLERLSLLASYGNLRCGFLLVEKNCMFLLCKSPWAQYWRGAVRIHADGSEHFGISIHHIYFIIAPLLRQENDEYPLLQ